MRSYWIRVGCNPIAVVLKRRENLDTEGSLLWEDKGRDWSQTAHQARSAKDCQQRPVVEETREDFP